MRRKSKLRQFFEDSTGALSSTRLVLILTAIFFFGNWLYALIRIGEFKPSIELITFVSATLATKAVQTFTENK